MYQQNENLNVENSGLTGTGAIGAGVAGGAKNPYSYDYVTVETSEKFAPECVDCYEALGYGLVKSEKTISLKTALTFKRDRKIKNREQLNRLQVKLNDHVNSVGVLEKKKTSKATAVAIMLGVIGTLIFGAGLCFCMPDVFQSKPDVWMYIVGGALALIGSATAFPAYFAFKKIRAKMSMMMSGLIDKKRDEISQICEDAQRLLA